MSRLNNHKITIDSFRYACQQQCANNIGIWCNVLTFVDDVDLSFSKLLVATPEDVQREIIDVEKTALQTQLAEDGGVSPQTVWSRYAIL